MYFGEGIEAGIDLKGNLYAWPKPRLPASAAKSEAFNTREDVVLIDKDKNNVHIEFTKVVV